MKIVEDVPSKFFISNLNNLWWIWACKNKTICYVLQETSAFSVHLFWPLGFSLQDWSKYNWSFCFQKVSHLRDFPRFSFSIERDFHDQDTK